MAYRRKGTCNQCGECCGRPRATDGIQNQIWPSNWPGAISNWSEESLKEYLPLLSLLGQDCLFHKQGIAVVRGIRYPWAWVAGHGLVKSETDFSCPFLEMEGDHTRCPLVGTGAEFIWRTQCQSTPHEVLSAEHLAAWQINCPSCSFTWEEG